MLRRHAEILEGVVAAYTRNVEHQVPIHPEYVAYVLDELADDDAIFTVDTGMCNVWAARYLTPNGRRRVIGSWRHGTMANALPQAIGAQLAFPGRQVVSMSGDGGLAMLLGELLTVRLHDLPLKIALFNNASLGMVKLEMLVAGMPDFETDHPPVDFSAIARAVGIDAIRVEEPGAGSRRPGGRARPQGSGARRVRHRPQRPVDAAEHHRRADQGLRPGGEQDRPRRRRREDDRAGAQQPAQHPAALTRRRSCDQPNGCGARVDAA